VGHSRPFGDVDGMSALPPIATELLHYGNRRAAFDRVDQAVSANCPVGGELRKCVAGCSRRPAPLPHSEPSSAISDSMCRTH